MLNTDLKQSLPGAHNVTRTVLDNGMTVLVHENPHVQSVNITGSLHAGSIYEDPAHGGMAALTASALMRGTQNRDFDGIHSALEDIGADLNISAATHRVNFGGKALAEDLPVLLDVLADSLRYPAFPAAQVERLRGERLTWMQYDQQNTRWVAGRGFRQHLYPDTHPYHYATRGTLETVPTIQVEELHEFHKAHYGPRGMILVVVGAVQATYAVEAVRRYFGDWQNPNQPDFATLPEISAPTETIRAHSPVPGKSQSDIMLGTLGPSRFAEDFQAANIANSVLGVFGMMGRVGQVIREDEGMAYYAYSRLSGGFGPGAWSISAGVNPQNVDKAIDLAINELRRLTTEPVSQEDLENNQSYYTGRLPLQLESNGGVASTLHSIETYDLGLDYLLSYHERIYSLTVDDLLAAAQHYLTPDALVISVAGPA